MLTSFLKTQLAKSETFANTQQGLSRQQLGQGKDLIQKKPIQI
jgi:hypothetical protein